MNHAKTLGIKLIINIIVVYSIFGIFGNANLINLFWISLLATAIAYFVGDRMILPRYGNVMATLADFPLAFASLWLLGSLFLEISLPLLSLSLFAAFFITMAEPLLHAYIQNQDPASQQDRAINTRNLQTEFAEESDAQDILGRPKRDKQNKNDNDDTGWY